MEYCINGIPWISDQGSWNRKQLEQGKARGLGHFWKSGPTLGISKSKEDVFKMPIKYKANKMILEIHEYIPIDYIYNDKGRVVQNRNTFCRILNFVRLVGIEMELFKI